MEIAKKAIISVNSKSEEVEAVIDTGAERTMINEEVFKAVIDEENGTIKLTKDYIEY